MSASLSSCMHGRWAPLCIYCHVCITATKRGFRNDREIKRVLSPPVLKRAAIDDDEDGGRT